jgi:hypothetical protein
MFVERATTLAFERRIDAIKYICIVLLFILHIVHPDLDLSLKIP